MLKAVICTLSCLFRSRQFSTEILITLSLHALKCLQKRKRFLLHNSQNSTGNRDLKNSFFNSTKFSSSDWEISWNFELRFARLQWYKGKRTDIHKNSVSAPEKCMQPSCWKANVIWRKCSLDLKILTFTLDCWSLSIWEKMS